MINNHVGCDGVPEPGTVMLKQGRDPEAGGQLPALQMRASRQDLLRVFFTRAERYEIGKAIAQKERYCSDQLWYGHYPFRGIGHYSISFLLISAIIEQRCCLIVCHPTTSTVCLAEPVRVSPEAAAPTRWKSRNAVLMFDLAIGVFTN